MSGHHYRWPKQYHLYQRKRWDVFQLYLDSVHGSLPPFQEWDQDFALSRGGDLCIDEIKDSSFLQNPVSSCFDLTSPLCSPSLHCVFFTLRGFSILRPSPKLLKGHCSEGLMYPRGISLTLLSCPELSESPCNVSHEVLKCPRSVFSVAPSPQLLEGSCTVSNAAAEYSAKVCQISVGRDFQLTYSLPCI